MSNVTLESLKSNLDDDIKNEFEDLLEDRYYDDRLHEMADSAVPIYHADRASVLASDPGLEVQDMGLVGDSASIMDLIGVAIYEELRQHASEEFDRLKEEFESTKSDLEDEGFVCERIPGRMYCILEGEEPDLEEGEDDPRPILVEECGSETEAWIELMEEKGLW